MPIRTPVSSRLGASPGLDDDAARATDRHYRIFLIDYDSESIDELPDTSLAACEAFATSPKTTWLHIQGQPDHSMLSRLGEWYALHTLALEDVFNQGQRPKVDAYDDHAFIVLNLPTENNGAIELEQVSLFVGTSFVISFSIGEVEFVDPIRERLRVGTNSRLRNYGSGYLCYALIDLVIDSAFPILDGISDNLDFLSEQALSNPGPSILEKIHEKRLILITLRRGLTAQRDLVNLLIRDEHPYIDDRTKLYLRDCYDHAIRVNESIENYRDLTASTQELYMSSISNRMNDVVKVLTIISTIFIPLSFFTGLYGMNFNTEASPWNMPELNLRFAYPALLLFLAFTAAGMLIFFKRKRWW